MYRLTSVICAMMLTFPSATLTVRVLGGEPLMCAPLSPGQTVMGRNQPSTTLAAPFDRLKQMSAPRRCSTFTLALFDPSRFPTDRNRLRLARVCTPCSEMALPNFAHQACSTGVTVPPGFMDESVFSTLAVMVTFVEPTNSPATPVRPRRTPSTADFTVPAAGGASGRGSGPNR